jgi:hypothetical protein
MASRRRKKQPAGCFGTIITAWARIQLLFTIGGILVNAVREYNTDNTQPIESDYRRR